MRGFPSQVPIKKTCIFPFTPYVFDEDTDERITIWSQKIGLECCVWGGRLLWVAIGLLLLFALL